MGKVLMIGAGGVATVAAFKIAQNTDVFTDFMIASRRKEKCDQIVEAIHKKGYTMPIKTAQVDADDVEQLKALFNDYQPELVINLALPYQDLTIMEACLACGCNYLDTANYEPKDEAHFEYSWQWAYKERFEQAGLCAILGCGFDPGVSGIYTAYAAKHHFDEMTQLDIVDCNAGNHRKGACTAVLHDFQHPLPVTAGKNAIHRIHEAITVNASCQQKRQHRKSRRPDMHRKITAGINREP